MSRPGLVAPFDTDPALSPLEKITKSLGYICQIDTHSKAHDIELMRNMKCMSAEPNGNLEFEVMLTESLCNRNKILHAAATTLMFDVCSMCAVVGLAKPGFWAIRSETNPDQAFFLGSSRNLDTTFVRPAPLGSVVRISITPLHVGTRNALINCSSYDKVSGKLLSHGSHDIVNLASMGKL